MKRRAVITGIGIVSPLGCSMDAFWSAALTGKSAWAPIPEHWRHFYQPASTIWAPLPTCDFGSVITRIEGAQTDRVQQIALVCAAEALDAAGVRSEVMDERKRLWSLRGVDSETAGVFVGTGMAGAATLETMFAAHAMQSLRPAFGEWVRKAADVREPGPSSDRSALVRLVGQTILDRVPERFNPFSVAMAMPNGIAAVLGIRYGIRGRNAVNAGACAAGTIAIGHALRAIQSGEVTFALAGGVEYLTTPFGGAFRSFDVVQALVRAGENPGRANRPFDMARSGFLFAEGGGAVLVVEEREHALRRNAPIIAELAGCAETFDAYSVMMPEPSGVQVERMIRMAVADAGMEPADIDYVNAHGTGTVVNDALEATVLNRVFGERPLVNSTKGLIGHTIGASGAIEAAVAALSIRDQTTHPCANLDNPIPGLRYVRAPGRFPIRTVLSESFAFGGHNAAVVLKAHCP